MTSAMNKNIVISWSNCTQAAQILVLRKDKLDRGSRIAGASYIQAGRRCNFSAYRLGTYQRIVNVSWIAAICNRSPCSCTIEIGARYICWLNISMLIYRGNVSSAGRRRSADDCWRSTYTVRVCRLHRCRCFRTIYCCNCHKHKNHTDKRINSFHSTSSFQSSFFFVYLLAYIETVLIQSSCQTVRYLLCSANHISQLTLQANYK